MNVSRRPRLLSSSGDPAEDCSALFDGMGDRELVARVLRAMARDPGLRHRFARYALIQSALRGQLVDASLGGQCASRVAARVSAEDPPVRDRSVRPLLGWALAAGLVVAVFTTLVLRGVLSFSPSFVTAWRTTSPPVASVPPRIRLTAYGAALPTTWRRGAPGERRVLDEYLLTHLVTPGYAPVMVHARLASYEIVWDQPGATTDVHR